MSTSQRLRVTPRAELVRVRERDNWRGHDRDDGRRFVRDREGDGWGNRNHFDRDDDRAHDRDDCRIAPRSNQYSNNYRPDFYPQAYDYAPQSYHGPFVAKLIQQRSDAQALYQRALRRGDRVGAKHLHNDIVELNKRIGGAEQRG